MLNKKECIAMLLAGGQGSRLYALTNNVAKPAVSYGAKYKLLIFHFQIALIQILILLEYLLNINH